MAGAFNPLRSSLDAPDPFDVLTRGMTASTSTSASNGAVAAGIKAPVHTIHHTKLKRGKELGQVGRIKSVAHCMYICMCVCVCMYVCILVMLHSLFAGMSPVVLSCPRVTSVMYTRESTLTKNSDHSR